MTNAKRDENNISTLICALNTDGTTTTLIQVNPTNHGLKIDDASTGSDAGNNGNSAMKDENGVSVLTAVSSVDGSSIVEVYANSSGQILIDSQ